MFSRSVAVAISLAQKDVRENLPRQVAFRFPGKGSRKEINFDQITEKMYGDGAFSPLIDVAVCGIKNNETVVCIIPSALPLTTDLARTWNQPPGAGPFKAAGLLLPTSMWDRDVPFRLVDLAESYATFVEDNGP